MYGFEIDQRSVDYRMARAHVRDEPREITYYAYAAIHPLHLMLQASCAITALLTVPWLILVAAPAVGVLTVLRLAHSESVRMSARHDHQLRRRREAEGMRAQVLEHMSDIHRVELQELELLVDLLRERAGSQAGTDLVLDQHLDIDELLAAYARLAIAHRDIERRLSLTSANIHAREPAGEDVSPELGALEEQRASLARRRKDLHVRARERLARIEIELASVADTVRMLHEQSIVARPEIEATGDEVNVFVAELDAYLDALAALDGDEHKRLEPAPAALP